MEEMLKIKGFGLTTAAGFMAEVGGITRFEHARQIQKLAGLKLKEDAPANTKEEQSSANGGENG